MNASGTPARSKCRRSCWCHSLLPWPTGMHGLGPGLLHAFKSHASAAQVTAQWQQACAKATLTTLLAAGDKRVRVFDSLWSTFTQFPRALPLTMYSGKLSGLRIASATLLVLNEGSARVAAAAVHSVHSCRGAPPPGGYSTSCTSMPRSRSRSTSKPRGLHGRPAP